MLKRWRVVSLRWHFLQNLAISIVSTLLQSFRNPLKSIEAWCIWPPRCTSWRSPSAAGDQSCPSVAFGDRWAGCHACPTWGSPCCARRWSPSIWWRARQLQSWQGSPHHQLHVETCNVNQIYRRISFVLILEFSRNRLVHLAKCAILRNILFSEKWKFDTCKSNEITILNCWIL